MTINITGRNIKLTAAIKKYVEEKIHKLDRYLNGIEPTEVNVNLQANKGKGEKWMKVEVTLSIPNLIIRSEEMVDSDLYGAIDVVQEKLERKIRDQKERFIKSRREVNKLELSEFGGVDTKHLKRIIKRKQFDIGSPISENEAIARMELLGHDFHIYIDKFSKKQNVVYRRRDGGYGIIESKQ